MMSGITTHVLDTSRGRPAVGVPVALEIGTDDGGWVIVGEGITDADGRLKTLVPEGVAVERATYRLIFRTGDYFQTIGVDSFFFPEIAIVFRIDGEMQHYHVPLLLSPYGYATYRGS
ncbi:MAG TPA: hydroxyisourate hydrolase [Thermoanaerobaculia bacterium]|nr:hydroxyisourate hydrolase [Thermoanaerobaculia bacterium]